MDPTNSVDTQTHPRSTLWGIWIVASLLCIVVALVALAKLTERPLVAIPGNVTIIKERVIYLERTRAGTVQVRDETGQIIASWDVDDAGFVSTLARVVKRERLKRNASPDAPIVLRKRDGNIPTIFDPETGHEIELNSFGDDNVSQVLSLLTVKSSVN